MAPEVLSAIIAVSISLVISTVVAAWAQRKKLESDYDAALRAERLVEYRRLWKLMEPIGWYGKHEITSETTKNYLPISTTGILKGEVSCFRMSHTKALKNCNGRFISTMVCQIICAPLAQNFGLRWLMILAGENDLYCDPISVNRSWRDQM